MIYLNFPEARMIYLYNEKEVPEKSILRLNFGEQGFFDYEVKNFDFLQNTTEELNRKKLIILIPFALLRLRKAIEKKRTPENLAALQKLIQNDIIGSINENLRVGNISVDDARQLRRLTHKLYAHIYSHYEEMEELNDMTDESLILDIDIINKEREKELAEQAEFYQEKLAEKDNALVQKDNVIAGQKEEIIRLKQQLEELKNK